MSDLMDAPSPMAVDGGNHAGSQSQDLDPPRKRKRDDGGEEVVEPQTKRTAGDDSTSVAEKKYRFKVGDRVLCNMSKRKNGFAYKLATVAIVAHEVEGQFLPYVCELDNDGGLAASPEDDDDCVRLAARACLDTRIMRVFAVPDEKQRDIKLRFMEGDRVAVQLDVGIWEEGVIVEVWSRGERGGKVLKTWAGVAVPYAVRLDLGEHVMVPFDTDEVIRPESATLPPQKSVAEQINGTDKKPRQNSGPRFVVRKNAAGAWVRVDTLSGFERPCDPPDSDDDA